MATAEQLRGLALSLPEATERPMHGTPAFYVKTKFFTKLSRVPAKVTKAELRELVTDSWRLWAPKRLVAAFDAGQP